MKNFLGIVGGLGPLASSYFYELITTNTEATKDQDHINMVLLSHATIADRTAYILGKSKDNPYPDLKNDVKTLEKMGADLIAIPCNTACYFWKDLQQEVNIPILNLIEETVKYLKNNNMDNVLILATTGTIESHLYQDACKKYDISYQILNDKDQEGIMHIIFENVKKGQDIDLDIWNNIINNSNCNYFILGCTELSILKKALKLPDNFIDPLEIETEIILKHYGKKSLKK